MKSEVRQRIDQIRHGEVPRGYKKTKAGILPVDWTIYLIKDCLERVEHPVSVQADEMYTQIGIRSHGKGLFYKEPINGESLGKKAVFWIEPDCFVLNIVFAWEQAIGKTTQNEVGMIGSHRFPMYRSVDGRIDIDYLIEYLMTKRGKDILEAASPGGAGRNRTLGQERFMKSKIILPTKSEQQKIAEIIKLQERVIELNSQIIKQLELMKKACLRKMFPEHGSSVPEVRFPGFTDPWEQRKLGDITERITRKNQDLESELPLTISAQYGLIDQNEFFDKRIASKDVSGYYLVKKGEFAYNKSTSSDAPWGAVKRLDRYEKGVLSTLYIVFSIWDTDKTNSDYLMTYYDTDLWHKGVKAIAAEGARNHGLLNITPSDFFETTLLIPQDIEEQKLIGKYFIQLDTLINLHQRKRDEEKQKKKALMQLLFSGIVRVTV